MRKMQFLSREWIAFLAASLLLAFFGTEYPLFAQGASGRIEGIVKDETGAVVVHATVEVHNADTGLDSVCFTDSNGHYYFALIPVGVYGVSFNAAGFGAEERDHISVDVASEVRVDATLRIGEIHQEVQVDGESLDLDERGAETGLALRREQTSQMPLNGRSYTDLLALQAGVAPVTSMTSETVQGLGQSVFAPSGDINAGVLSINGQRESANLYIVNGANAEETGSMSAAIVPNLDSIEEFKILIGNFDAEYGRYSGGQVSVVTRSGANRFHGDAFEYVRNTDFDARNYFSQGRAKFQQNQFGGALGGPIRRDRTFFFADYQQTRQIRGADTGLIPVPTVAERNGDFSELASVLMGTVSGNYFATLLSEKLGYSVSSGEPYYFNGCTLSSECVFPGAMIPQSAWSEPGKTLLAYIPKPNVSDSEFSTSAYNGTLNDGKGALRLDATTRAGRFFAYGAFDGYHRDDPYPTGQGGASVPGFNALSAGGSRLLVLEHDRALGTSAFNQIHLSYTRVVNDMGRPHGGLGLPLDVQGFTTGADTLGIVAGEPEAEGVENVVLNNFTIGVSPNQFLQFDNVAELSEDLSRVFGKHTLKAGLHIDRDEINTFPAAQLNGSFQFYGTETGSDFADFLIGVASQYNQNALRPFYERENYAGAYAEDSWRAASQMTLSLGLRWDRIEPWWEKYNNAMTLVPGEQSQVFPTAPLGLVFPGDRGIARSLAPARNLDFGPRFGIAWTPHFAGRNIFGFLLGENGVLRGGFGIYYSAIPGETLSLISDNAPYGFTYSSPAPPLFATPFMDAATGNPEGQRFPANLAPLNVSRSNPDSNVDWSQFEPIAAVPGYAPTNRTPYTNQYTLTIERAIGRSAVAEITYAGNQAHRLLVLKAANPGDAALCLALSNLGAVASGSPTCGPFGESTTYTTATSTVIDGTRGPLGPAFGSVSTQSTIGDSSYNALQANLRANGRWGQLLAGYTWSKSLDMGSNFGDQVNPFNPRLSRALSAFDLRHNLVVSYVLKGRVPSQLRLNPILANGWELSGITRMNTGMPVTLINYGDTSLWGTQSNGVNNLPVDLPDFDSSGGSLRFNHNPRNGSTYFDTSHFSIPSLGDPGNARRRFFSGPGMENFDMSLQKSVAVRESANLSIRVEAFNIFNHAQFFGPQAVDGNITDASGEFGHVVSAQSPRLLQVSLKVAF